MTNSVRDCKVPYVSDEKLFIPLILHLAPWGLLTFWIFAWGLIQREGLFGGGGLKNFFVVDRIPAQIFLLTNYIFDTTHTSNMIFLKDRRCFVH